MSQIKLVEASKKHHIIYGVVIAILVITVLNLSSQLRSAEEKVVACEGMSLFERVFK